MSEGSVMFRRLLFFLTVSILFRSQIYFIVKLMYKNVFCSNTVTQPPAVMVADELLTHCFQQT